MVSILRKNSRICIFKSPYKLALIPFNIASCIYREFSATNTKKREQNEILNFQICKTFFSCILTKNLKKKKHIQNKPWLLLNTHNVNKDVMRIQIRCLLVIFFNYIYEKKNQEQIKLYCTLSSTRRKKSTGVKQYV
jgi:hypothetical protein